MCVILSFLAGIAIKSTLDQSTTVQYASLISQLASKARSTVRDIDPQVPSTRMVPRNSLACDSVADCDGWMVWRGADVWQNDLTFLRIRSKKHEIMVAPGKYQRPPQLTPSHTLQTRSTC